MRRQSFYGWKLVAVLFALDFLNMGFPFFGGSIINTYMLKQIPMARSTYGLGFTLLNLFIGLPSVLVAAVIVRWGARAAFALGSAMICAGALWLALFASRPWHYLAAYGVITATGISFSTIVPVTTVATRWFRKYRARAMAIPLSASGFAGFVGAPLINRILAANGGNWRQAWMVVGAIAIGAGILAILFVRERPEDLGQTVDGKIEPETPAAAAGNASEPASWTAHQAYRAASYWLILIGGIGCQFPYFFFVAHWILHLRSLRIDPGTAAWALGSLTLGGIVGRLIGGYLMDKSTPRYAFMLGLTCYLAGSLLAISLHTGTVATAFAAAALYGIAFGWSFVCLNAITARYFGPESYPRLNGMMLLLTGAACSPAGVIGGAIFDRSGTYTGAFVLNMALALAGIVALAFATAPRLSQASLPVTANA